MKWLDWVLVSLVALYFAGVLIWICRRKRQGKTCCGCAGCSACSQNGCRKCLDGKKAQNDTD